MADISKIKDIDGTTYDLKDPVARVSIPFGQVDSTSTSTVFTATVPGITELYDGVCIFLRNSAVTSAANFTLNINGLGAKPVYSTMAEATRVTTTFNVAYTMLFIYNSTRVTDGCWDMYYGYYTNTTMAYGSLDYYFRPYAGQAIYRYKLLLQGEDHRLYPVVTTNQTSATQVAKVPTTVGLRPGRIWYYGTTTAISAGAVIGAQTLQKIGYTTGAVYSFNTSISTYRTVYLRGTYDKDKDLFYLYNDGSSPCTSYYTQVPTNTANITLSSYFVEGYYYMLVGGSYSTANYLSIFGYNPLYYFDGTNLVPASTKVAQDLVADSPISNELHSITEKVTEDKPYAFRTSGGDIDISGRDSETLDRIIGGTVAWNQLCTTDTSLYTKLYSSLAYTDGVFRFEITATNNARKYAYRTILVTGHKYLLTAAGQNHTTSTVSVSHGTVSGSDLNPREHVVSWASTDTDWVTKQTVFQAQYSTIAFYMDATDRTVGDYALYKNVVLCDLTQMFGSTIADYIYNLEQTTAGAGVAWFRKYFPNDYYAYNAGELMSVNLSAHKTVGFNRMNVADLKVGSVSNYNQAVGAKLNTAGSSAVTIAGTNPVTITNTTNWRGAVFISNELIPGKTYQLSYRVSGTTIANIKRSRYVVDSNNVVVEVLGNDTSVAQNSSYVYKHSATIAPTGYGQKIACVFESNSAQTISVYDICVHEAIESRDGDYEPYEDHSYPLDSSLTLRGIPKLDANNELYYDGDIYESSGEVTRRFMQSELSALSWTKRTYSGTDYYSAKANSSFTANSQQTAIMAWSSVYTINPSTENILPAAGEIVMWSGYVGSGERIIIRDDSVTSASALVTKLTGKGQVLCNLKTDEIESAVPIPNPQVVDEFGTEEFVDAGVVAGTRDVAIPADHVTSYMSGLRSRIDTVPDNPMENGYYLLKHEGGVNTYEPVTYVTPEMFGAKGDGVADDTAAIQKAVSVGGLVLFHGNATYKITAQIDITAPCTIDGAGCTVQLTPSATREKIFYVDSDYVTIKNFKVVSSRTKSFVNGGTTYSETLTDNNSFVYVNSGNYGRAENITADSVFSVVFFGYGDVAGIKDWVIRDIYATNVLFGIHLAYGKNTVVENFDLSLVPDGNVYCHCIYINDHADGITIRDGKLTANLTPVTTNPPKYPLIDSHINTTGNTVNNLVIDRVTMKNNVEYAVRAESTVGVKVSRCIIDSPYMASINSNCTGALIFDSSVFNGERLGVIYNTRLSNMDVTCTTSNAMHQISGCILRSCHFDVPSFVTTTYDITVYDSDINYTASALSISDGATVNVKFFNCRFFRATLETTGMKGGSSATGTLVLVNCTTYNVNNFASAEVTALAKAIGNYAYK